MLTITLLFANLSKLVAICNILSKYCLCQNRKPFFDLPRQRCAHNCLPTTLHSPHRGEAYSQHCAIVGRPRAVWPLHGGVALVRRYLVTGAFYLATFANLVADRTAVCLTQVFALPLCICGNHSTSLPHPTTRPWNIVRHKSYSIQTLLSPQDYRLLLKWAAFSSS